MHVVTITEPKNRLPAATAVLASPPPRAKGGASAVGALIDERRGGR